MDNSSYIPRKPYEISEASGALLPPKRLIAGGRKQSKANLLSNSRAAVPPKKVNRPSVMDRSQNAKPTQGSPPKKQGRKKKHWLRRIFLSILFVILGVIIAGLAAFLYLYVKLPIPAPSEFAQAQRTAVYYQDNKTEIGAYSSVNRTVIDPSTLHAYTGQAIVASEDRTFFTNSGVDFKGIARALINNLRGGARQGASTLSQQYVERYFNDGSKDATTYKGKIKEAVLAIKINREQSKDEILGNYMNTIYFGRGAYGIDAAARAYFGHPAKDLTLSESAMIAGIIPAPSLWDPAVNEDQARFRWRRVLNLMVEDGWINKTDSLLASFPKTIDPVKESSSMVSTTGYIMQQVKDELKSTGAFTNEQIESGGLRVVTTIDKEKQDLATKAALSMKDIKGWDPQHMHVALSAVKPDNGEIVAQFAGADYQKVQRNAVTQDIAPAGSTFKVFTLLAHLDQGGSLHDRYNGNSPQRFDGLQNTVSNNDGISYGSVTLLKATEQSVNTAYVALNEKIGPKATMDAAVKAGIPKDTSGLDATLLNTLGVSAPHNIDLARAFSTIASGGIRTDTHIVREVLDYKGNRVYVTPVNQERQFDIRVADQAMAALQSVTTRSGTASEAGSVGHYAAGKTGTSSDQLSAQFVGMVPGMVSAVSMYQSDDKGNPVPLDNIGGLDEFHGGDWPVHVWTEFMKAALAGVPNDDYSWRIASSPPEQQVPVQQVPVQQVPVQQAPVQQQAPAPESQNSEGQRHTTTGSENTDGTRRRNSTGTDTSATTENDNNS